MSNLQGISQSSIWFKSGNLYLRENPWAEAVIIIACVLLVVYGGSIRKKLLPMFPKSQDDRIRDLETDVKNLTGAISTLTETVSKSMEMDSQSVNELWKAHGRGCEDQSKQVVEIWNRIHAIERRLPNA